ncbi:hypothetical protein GJ496_002458 [Pomphorhynchus laevis]|nr:hypothetical protein GJ496_002458 [Pomphorhynchus laevis]
MDSSKWLGDSQSDIEPITYTKRKSSQSDLPSYNDKRKKISKINNEHNPRLESDYGISEFINEGPSLSLLFRHRYSDFIVNEIGMDGNLVELTNSEIPIMSTQSDQATELEIFDIDESIKENIKDASNAVLSTSGTIRSVIIGKCDKNTRTVVHKYIKSISKRLSSSTVQNGDDFSIEISLIGNPKSKNFKRDFAWPKHVPNYLTFVMYKENIDTIGAIYKIAGALRIGNISRFSYAGLKDKRGKTTQLVTAYRMKPIDVVRVNSTCNNIRVGNFRFSDQPLRIGNLKGNTFTIILRNVTDSVKSTINERLKNLIDYGFINYFGMQRFGCYGNSTDQIGLLFLKQDWAGAIKAILQPSDSHSDQMQMALSCYQETEDAQKAISFILNEHGKDCNERRILESLAEYPSDYSRSISCIPRNTRTLYLHAYQSKIWNHIASYRYRTYGLEAKAGDLIKDGSDSITVLDTDNCAPISQVMLPMIGSDIKYPENIVAQEIDRLLEIDNINKNVFKSMSRDFCLKGSYRDFIVKLDKDTTEVTYKPISDFSTDDDSSDAANTQATDGNTSSEKFAAQIKFKLPTSSYATMAIREVIRGDI